VVFVVVVGGGGAGWGEVVAQLFSVRRRHGTSCRCLARNVQLHSS